MCLGVPGKIIELYQSNGLKMCKVDFGGVIREACIEALPEAKLNDFTIVHAGFALSLLSEEEARETLDILSQLSIVEHELGEQEQES
ncbi:MAG: HypC/HybG/HupF family hydrogenase formation chaperone [Anaerolineae bacterium]|nr:HypC/HybG/HupF family hydrogenase formation chaperone [Anaerolineae bacterium]